MVEVCVKYSTSFINVVSMTFSIIIVMLLSVGVNKAQKYILSDSIQKIENNLANTIVEEDNKEVYNTETHNADDKTLYDWYIEIPKINLYAPIEEGTEDEILNRSVGHFENTSRRNGNCGLAAHNRGYRVNYFSRVKELEKGDTIYYFVDGKKYQYKVNDILIIYETDWSMLDETKDNRITLLTCAENRAEYRLCVQAILVE